MKNVTFGSVAVPGMMGLHADADRPTMWDAWAAARLAEIA